MNLNFIPATTKDIPTILEMMEDFYLQEGITYDNNRANNTLKDFISKENVGTIWLIQRENETIGYCCIVYSYTLEYHGRDCFIDEIFVKKQFQHQGIGRTTLEYVEQYAKKNNLKAIHLFVFNKNKYAYDFYKKNGFMERDGKLMVKMVQDIDDIN